MADPDARPGLVAPRLRRDRHAARRARRRASRASHPPRSRGSSAAASPDGDGNLGRFRVGRVLEAGKHPNADRLQLCQGRRGRGRAALRSSAAPGTSAPARPSAVALPGAVLAERLEARAAKLRGETSDGMILAEDEVGLGDGARRDHGAARRVRAGHAARGRAAARRRRPPRRVDRQPARPAVDLRHRARGRGALRPRRSRPPPGQDPAAASATSRSTIRIDDFEGCPRYVGRLFRERARSGRRRSGCARACTTPACGRSRTSSTSPTT